MSLGPRPTRTSVPSGTLIHPAVWPQQTCRATKLGRAVTVLGRGARSRSYTTWPGRRPTSLPSFILIHPIVLPQYTNVTDRQTDIQADITGQDTGRQRSSSVGRTVFGPPFIKRFDLYAIGPLSCISCMSTCNAGVILLPNGWTDQDETWYAGRTQPRLQCVRWGPSCPVSKGHTSPIFGPCPLWPNGWMD